MTQHIETALHDTIDRLYVINLASRPDRRREMQAELDQLGFAPQSPLVEFFAAVKPETAGVFPSIGARGCFLSHLGVLERAQAAGHRAIIILEDDAAVAPGHRAGFADTIGELAALDWGLAYPGYRIDAAQRPGAECALSRNWCRLDAATGIETTHAMVIHQRVFAPLIAYFSAMLERPAGHPEGGPMHVDGAYSWFRRAYPDVLTVVTAEPHVLQRASRSDIAPPSWKDRLPFSALLRQLRNRVVRGVQIQKTRWFRKS